MSDSMVPGRKLRRGLRDESGSALVELAVTFALLGLPLFFATAHYGVLVLDSIIVENAAHAGAEYGMMSATYAANTSGITTAAQAEANGLGVTLGVTPTIFYTCSTAQGGTQYTTPTAANTACTGSSHSLQFIQVQVSATVTPAVSVPGLARSTTLTATSIMEVEE